MVQYVCSLGVELEVYILDDRLVLRDPPLEVVVVRAEVAPHEAHRHAVQPHPQHGRRLQTLNSVRDPDILTIEDILILIL